MMVLFKFLILMWVLTVLFTGIMIGMLFNKLKDINSTANGNSQKLDQIEGYLKMSEVIIEN